MGEGNAEKIKEEEKKGNGGGGEEGVAGGTEEKKKKKDGVDENGKKAPPGVVLRVDLHCDGCALKVKKAIKAAQGVEGVATDMAGSTVTVSGKADPWDLKDRIESRAHKAVAFVSPPNPPKKNTSSKKPTATAGKGNCDGKNKTSSDDKKNKEAPESTVVVKIRLHCNGCIDRIKRTAHKIKGVKQVSVDTAKEHVTVKGTMDAKTLPDVLRDKLKREVVLVVVPAAKKDSDKKQQGKGGDGENGKKKQEDKKKKQQDGDGDGEAANAMEMQMTYGGGGGGGGYRVEMLQSAPQLFSDENPNACSLM